MKCCCFWFNSLVKFFTLESGLSQKCSLYSGERSVPLGALVMLGEAVVRGLIDYIRTTDRKTVTLLVVDLVYGPNFAILYSHYTIKRTHISIIVREKERHLAQSNDKHP